MGYPSRDPEYARDYRRKRYASDPQRINEYGKKYHRKLRRDVIAIYGGACACCRETEYQFLGLDHVNGGGNVARKAGATAQRVMAAIRKVGAPDPEYQILCHNGNLAKGFYGECPHKKVS